MATIDVRAEGAVAAAPDTVYLYLADMRQHHPRFLPPAFSDFAVEEGGVGEGTVIRFTVTAGGRSRQYVMDVTEPEPGRVLVEKDRNSSLATQFTITPQAGTSLVEITTSWEGAGGVGGFFERLFAPKAMQRIYLDELRRLDDYARRHAATMPDGS